MAAMARRRTPGSSKGKAATSPYLTDLPRGLELLRSLFQEGGVEKQCTPELDGFACSFLGALEDSQALLPEMEIPAPELLALVLTHHLRNPGYGASWLNLGLALRLIANSENEPRAAIRRQKAIECFDRCLSAPESARPVEIRARIGKALTLVQLKQFDAGVRCSREALELDRSDPDLWLLHSSVLGLAGRKEEALELIDQAYRAYVMAGRPEGLRHLFGDVVPSSDTPDPTAHLQQIQ
jgi:tetratricopeptide (TPR) repeat protein